MKVITKYPYQGVPGMQQLSFPAGVKIQAKDASNHGGWMFGSFRGQNGWFPESYVERYGGLPAAPQHPLAPLYEHQTSPTRTAAYAPTRPRSPHLSYDNARAEENDSPPLRDIAFDKNEVNRARAYAHGSSVQNGDIGQEEFSVMGGNPGDLFEGTPTPSYDEESYTTPTVPTFLKEQEEKPVDIYRHAPPSKWRNHRSEYSPEISVQITSKTAPSTSTPTSYSSRTAKVAPATDAGTSPTSAPDFWKAHPGRADRAPSAQQAAELERGFEGLRDSETIQFVPAEEKKKKFPYIPKTLKKAAKKTQKSIQGAVHKLPTAHRS